MFRTARIALFAISLAATPAAFAQATFPSTPQAQTVKAWIDAINNPDPAATQAFDPRAAMVRRDFNGFEVLGVETPDANTVVTTLRERMFDSDIRMNWMLNPADPTKMNGFRFQRLPSNLARLDDAQLAAWTSDAMKRMDYSGAVLVARNGKPVVTGVAGLADREAKIPNKLDTSFRVGSMNKMMTAVGVLQLVQAGKVKLDAPVGTYLKDYPNKEFANSVTIHHLLSHTGGAGDIFGPQYNAKRLELKTLKDYVDLYGSRAGEFTPGDNWKYANYGFVLLGRVIEEVSGQSYPDYIRDHVFKPAGMKNSGFEPESANVPNRAKGYMNGPNGIESNANTLPYAGTSAGGGYSTVEDWLAFSTALTGHKLLDKKHTELMMTRKTSTGYAYGYGDNSTADIRAGGHNGGAPGMNGNLSILADGQVVVVTLVNVSPPSAASTLATEIMKRVKVLKPDGTVASNVWGPGGLPVATEEARAAAFKAADTDDDGKLDRAAYRKALQQLGFADQFATYWAQRDKDGDGFISAEEYKTPIGTTGPTPPPPQ
jgi:CubicO group peptidase (beta-lactamase class C family)